MSDLLLQILDTPQAPLILQQAQAILNDERTKRQAFYEWLDEDKNSGRRPAEFINGEVVVHSPALDRHNSAMLLLARLLSFYVDDNHLGYVRAEKALIELTRDSYDRTAVAAGRLFFRPRQSRPHQCRSALLPGPRFCCRSPVEKHRESRPGDQICRLCRPRRGRILDHRPAAPNHRAAWHRH